MIQNEYGVMFGPNQGNYSVNTLEVALHNKGYYLKRCSFLNVTSVWLDKIKEGKYLQMLHPRDSEYGISCLHAVAIRDGIVLDAQAPSDCQQLDLSNDQKKNLFFTYYSLRRVYQLEKK